MCQRVLSIMSVLLLVSFVCTGATKIDEARAEWMNGFQKMETADKSSSGNVVGALELYRESLEIFENVRRKYPQWNPTLLNYRINYCQQRIREMEQKLESQANTLSQDELLALTKRQAKQLQESENARKELSSRVDFLSESLQRAREEASKGAGYEVAVANLSASKANNDKELEKLRIKIAALEDKLSKSRKLSSDAEKLAKELGDVQQRLAETTSGMSAMRNSLNEKTRENEKLERELKQIQRNAEDKETALRVATELSESRKQELVTLHNNVTSLEKKNKLLEKGKLEQETEIASYQRRELKLEEEIANLKKLRQADAASIDELRKGELSANEYKRMKEELDVANGKLKTNEATIKTLETDLADFKEKLKQAKNLEISREEKNLELTSKLATMTAKQEKSEARTLRLTAELEECKILLGQSKSNTEKQQRKLENADNVEQEKEALSKKLQVQIELARKQEVQITAQVAKIQDLELKLLDNEKENRAIALKLEDSKGREKDSLRQLKVSQNKVQELEKALAGAKANNAEQEKKAVELAEFKLESLNAKKLQELESANKKAQLEIADMKDQLALKEKRAAAEAENARRIEEALKEETQKVELYQKKLAEETKGFGDKLEAARNETALLQKKVQEQQQLLIQERAAAEAKYVELEQLFSAGDETQKKRLRSVMESYEENKKLSQRLVDLEQQMLQKDKEKENIAVELKKYQEEKALLGAKVQVVDGLTRTVDDLEEQVEELQGKIEQFKIEKEAMQRSADAKYMSYENRLTEKDQIIGDLRDNASDTPTWLSRLKEMEKKYDNALKQKGALEAVLVEMEAKLKLAQGEVSNQANAMRKVKEEQATAIRQAANAARAEAEIHAAQKAALAVASQKMSKAKEAQKLADEEMSRVKEEVRKAQEAYTAAEKQAVAAAQKVEEAHKAMSEQEDKIQKQVAEADEKVRKLQLELKEAEGQAEAAQADYKRAQRLDAAIKEESKKEHVLATKGRYTQAQNDIRSLRSSIENAQQEKDKTMQEADVLRKQAQGKAEEMAAESARLSVAAARRAAEVKIAMTRQTAAEAILAETNKDLEEARLYAQKLETQYKNVPALRTELPDTDELRFTREREKKAVVTGFLRQAVEAERQGKTEAAQHNYQQALSLDADNKLALQRLGLLASANGNDIDASRYLTQAFRFDPDDMDTLMALGFAQARLGRPDWAISYLGRAVALQPSNGNAVRSYGSALFSLGWTQAAEKQLTHAIELNGKDAEAQYNLAVLMATSQPPRLIEALKWYKEAIANGAEPDPGLDKVLKR